MPSEPYSGYYGRYIIGLWSLGWEEAVEVVVVVAVVRVIGKES